MFFIWHDFMMKLGFHIFIRNEKQWTSQRMACSRPQVQFGLIFWSQKHERSKAIISHEFGLLYLQPSANYK